MYEHASWRYVITAKCEEEDSPNAGGLNCVPEPPAARADARAGFWPMAWAAARAACAAALGSSEPISRSFFMAFFISRCSCSLHIFARTRHATVRQVIHHLANRQKHKRAAVRKISTSRPGGIDARNSVNSNSLQDIQLELFLEELEVALLLPVLLLGLAVGLLLMSWITKRTRQYQSLCIAIRDDQHSQKVCMPCRPNSVPAP